MEEEERVSIESELAAMMPHTITIQPYTNSDGWGNKNYGAAWTCRGRIVNKRRKVLSATGGEVISETTIYLDTTSEIGMDDLVTMPDGFSPRQPQIISVKRQSDESGLYYTILNC